MKVYILVLMLSISVGSLFAQKYSNEFLSIGVGAKAQALGNAVVAQTNDVTAGVWNPAGLGRQRRRQWHPDWGHARRMVRRGGQI